MRKFRVYVDTSVFGGLFDEEFKEASQIFFDQVQSQYFSLVTSIIVKREIQLAPEPVRNYFEKITKFAEIASLSQEALDLREAYLNAKIVTTKSSDDALHVALATVSSCSLIVSWNFKHIVHFDKIPLYNAINAVNGFPSIAIFSPQEVIKYEN